MATRLYVWGSGGTGQLGLGDTRDYALPQRFSVARCEESIVLESITCGGCHSAGLSATGELFVWGDNEKKQLGRAAAAADRREVTAPASAHLTRSGDQRVRFVACGWSHTLAVCTQANTADRESDGTSEDDCVLAWGAHEHHQLGRPVSTDTSSDLTAAAAAIPRFYLSGGALRVQSLACGWKHSLLCTATGEVYAWGSGRNGELGLGDAVLVAERPSRASVDAQVQRVLCGWQHSVFLTTDSAVLTCGNNRHGQLGRATAASSKVHGIPEPVALAQAAGSDVSPLLRASQVDVGWHFVLCVTHEEPRALLAWGKGSHGQLGLGSFDTAQTPTRVPFDAASGVRSIACGSEHALVVTNDGELWSCGWGEHGNLGHGDETNRSVLTKVAFFDAERLDVLAVRAGGAVSMALVQPR